MIRLPFLIAAVVVLALIAVLTPALRAAAAQSATRAAPAQRGMDGSARMHRQMADMKEADARLDALMKDMHAAVGEPKIAAIAAVIGELAEQQKRMRARMTGMRHMGGDTATTEPATPQPPEHQHGTVH